MSFRKAMYPALLVTGALLLLGCAGPTTSPPAEEGATEEAAADIRTQLALTDFEVRFPEPPQAQQAKLAQNCTEPKPPDLGCTTLCKPCVTFRCVDGEWVRDEIDWGILCEPRSPQDPGPTACRRSKLPDQGTGLEVPGYCPPQCDICF